MNKNKHNQGQTVVEVVVSLFIITIGIVGTLMLANYAIHAGSQSRERVQAALLVQEGIERVKNIRDTNWINNAITPTPWNKSFPNADSNTHYKETYVSDLTGWTLEPNKDETQGMFTKVITFPQASSSQITVNCTVSWTDTSGNIQKVTAIDYITNWRTNP